MSEKIDKELYFINSVLGAINNVDIPLLIYEGEKEVVKKALIDYKHKIEDETYSLEHNLEKGLYTYKNF